VKTVVKIMKKLAKKKTAEASGMQADESTGAAKGLMQFLIVELKSLSGKDFQCGSD
jgi:hypothetical protein